MRLRSLLVIAALALLAGACGRGLAADGSPVAATVNGEPIPATLVETLVRSQFSDPSAPRSPLPPDAYDDALQLQQQVLSQLIQDRIVAQAARDELGIEVSEAEIDEAFAGLAEQIGVDEEGLREQIRQRLRTVADVREQLAAVARADEVRARLAEDIDQATLQRLYEQRREQFRVADVSHILVESEQQARDILQQLRAGADFAQLAREHSIDEFSATNGGSLGENPPGRFVEEFDDAVWNAEEGELVGPVQTEFGWHVIRVNAFRTRPFDDVRDELRDEQAGMVFDAWFQEQLAGAEVEVAPRFGRWDPQLGQVVSEAALDGGVEPAPTPVATAPS